MTHIINDIHAFNKEDWTLFPKAIPFAVKTAPLMFEATYEDAHIYCILQKNEINITIYLVSDPDSAPMQYRLSLDELQTRLEKLSKYGQIVEILKNADDLHCDIISAGFDVV